MKIIGAFLFIFASSGAKAANTMNFDCPAQLSSVEVANEAYPNWELLIDQGKPSRQLDTVIVFDGNPSGMGALVPDQSSSQGTSMRSTWVLADPQTEYWMACIYRNSRAMLARRLPTLLKSCTLTNKVQKDGRVGSVVSFACDASAPAASR